MPILLHRGVGRRAWAVGVLDHGPWKLLSVGVLRYVKTTLGRVL